MLRIYFRIKDGFYIKIIKAWQCQIMLGKLMLSVFMGSMLLPWSRRVPSCASEFSTNRVGFELMCLFRSAGDLLSAKL